MEKKTPTSKNIFGVPVTEDWDVEYQTDKQQAKKMHTHLSKTLRLLGLLVPCVEVFYVMEKSWPLSVRLTLIHICSVASEAGVQMRSQSSRTNNRSQKCK